MDDPTPRDAQARDKRRAEAALRQNLHLAPDTADAVARDLRAPMRRKPASDDVDAARAAEARATEADR